MAAPTTHRTEALVIRVVPYGETSQVVHLATAEHGLVAAMAKGACRPGPAFQGGLVLGTVGTATLRRRRGAELELLTAFRMHEGFAALAADLRRFHAACYVLELLRHWMRPALPNPSLYRAATTALKAIAAVADDALGLWVVFFEARAVAAAGQRPVLDRCAACGQALAGTLLFSPDAGGAVHRACAPEGTRLALAPADLEALRRLYTVRIPELAASPPGPRAVAAVRRLHDALLPHLLERRPRAMAGLPRA